jgi:two-component system sensor histidine kinase and response regulator WspE
MIGQEAAHQLRETELLDFIFLANFSTRKAVSQVSGRGVGLDVVHSAVQEVRGVIRTNTELGVGTSFELQLPLTLSVMRSLLVEIDSEVYAFPLAALDHVVKLKPDDVREIEGRQYITFNNERVGLVSANQVFERQGKKEQTDDDDELLILIVSDHYNQYGLIVDQFLEIRDLVVQALDRRLKKVQDISSVALLEDGKPVLIVDVDDMVCTIDALITGNRLRRISSEELQVDRTVKRILVVDDSITVREVERKMLSVKGYDVQTAVDGLDGWNIIRSEDFDLLVTDIDMPRMNGIELVTLMRQDERFETLPIIIVSYKDREEDRAKGLEAGADYYLTKGSFQDETLVRAVEELIGTPSKS